MARLIHIATEMRTFKTWTASSALSLFVLSTLATVAAAATPAPPKTPEEIKQFVKTNCYDCHQGAASEGGLDFEQLSFDLQDHAVQDRWVRIFDRVESDEMPPTEYGETDGDQKEKFLAATRLHLRRMQIEQQEKLGRVQARRLTRLQVERSLQDLLGIDIPLTDYLPEESRSFGFTTVADGQSMSHFQLDAHLRTVDTALDEALRRALSAEDVYERDFDAQGVSRTNPKRRCREPEMREGKAVIWSSGLIYYGRIPATTANHDGWYHFEVTVSGLKLPKTGGVWSTVRTGLCVSTAPLLQDVTTFEAMEEPKTIAFDAWLPKGHMLEIRPGDDSLKKGRFEGGQVGVGEGEPQGLAGIAFDRITMKRIHQNGDDAHVRQLLFGDLSVVPHKDKRQPYQVVTKSPREDAARLMRAFANRTFRRPTTSDEIAPYVAGVQAAIDGGDDFVASLRMGYRALLCSPRFLYFSEVPGPLDDHAIATRLSYLLTNSTPDEQLRQLADAGKLHNKQTLQTEAARLLSGDEGRQFIHDFAGEWLDLDQINFTTPDRKLYPAFDTVVQQSMLYETETFLETMLNENLSVDKLVDADFTYLNSRLARFYKIDGIEGDELRRVTLAPETHRGGLITQGAILKVTANGSNTSPVLRGVWMMEKILGEAVPPPPTNVPAVEPDIRGATTIREQLAKHRSQGDCASCHAKIDPPGFALENFDPAGQWRSNYISIAGTKKKVGPVIDAGYQMADGTEFKDVEGFQALTVSKPRKLAACVAEKLLVYGTGAPIAFVDRDAVEAIVDESAAENYGLRSIVQAVVASPVFLCK
ncbi:DUF1592 domain-containing protein [Blastopirellula sp. JC732]|uniref:DUF1592 domain-containing protein n=1 Tax=Blastopirellula sediminis TaxID=2894196 RepID=A0A9X1MNB5_9BACT|nr:DUF1592 domain-containing protein [Blastopirellula sediminis]MCC9607302.1 DUF1592 domain-containing protein [Blastopirellula sediminis]MCC9629405.1 DUF1592 domain-containing protein [Blastopirellula sediminis]